MDLENLNGMGVLRDFVNKLIKTFRYDIIICDFIKFWSSGKLF